MDDAVRHRVKIARKEFIDSLDPLTICQLASSYNDGKPCDMFEEPIAGSFNICYPVAFPSQNNSELQKWIVRIPLPPCVTFVDEKLESEIATMRFVAEKTTIPLPRVHGYSFQKDSPVGFAFMIIDYIDGTALSKFNIRTLSESQRTHLYDQLATFFIQLRKHEFPHVGSFSISNNASGWTFDTPKRPLSVELNGQDLEGLQASDIIKKDTIFTSAGDYFASLLDLAFNMFERCKNSVYDEDDAELALYALHQFREVVNEWADSMYNSGPFILDHGDFWPHNIWVDDNLNIVGVIDWEWGYVVPVQLFLPPTWLTGCNLDALCKFLDREDYVKELVRFKSIIKDRGEEATSLLKTWDKIEEWGAFLVGNGLRYPTFYDTIYFGYFDLRRGHKSPRKERVQKFLQGDTCHRELIQRKLADRLLYLEELRHLGLEERDGKTVPVEATQTDSKLGCSVSLLSQWRYMYTQYINTTMFLSPKAVMTAGGFMVVTCVLYRLFR